MTAGEISMLLVLAVIAVPLGLAANREWNRAERAEREADYHAANAAVLEDERNQALYERDRAQLVVEALAADAAKRHDEDPGEPTRLAKVYTLGGGAS